MNQGAIEYVRNLSAGECDKCGDPAHVYFCSKPASISKEAWQRMSDDERLDAQRSSRNKAGLSEMEGLSFRAIAWRNGGDTGLSSVALVSFLMGWPIESVYDRGRHPLDVADLGRCIRALDRMPELRERLSEAKGMSPVWSALIDRWADLETFYRAEIATGRAPKCYALMQSIIDPIERAVR